MSPRQILFGKKFKTPLYKIGELVMAYDITTNNKTTIPRAPYALYIRPNDSGTGHQVFKLSSKWLVTSPKYKPVPMPDEEIKVVNDLGIQDGMPSGIKFRNTHHELILADLFADNDLNDYNINASNNDWGLNKNPEEDLKKITFDNHVDGSEVQDLNIDNKDILHLYEGGDLSHNIGVQHEQEDQHNHFGGPVADNYEPDGHLEDHDKGDNVDEEVDEVVQANEEIRLVGDDESSADDNFDMFEHDDQYDKSKEESVYESAEEDNAPINDSTKGPVEDR